MKTALVLGAGGFIGSHLVKRLKSEGYWVRGVDLKYPEFSESKADEFLTYDLRDPRNVDAVVRLQNDFQFNYSIQPFQTYTQFDEIYQLAADMGGAGYIFTGEHDADVMHNSATINLNVLDTARRLGVGKIFYSSSACMYPQQLQEDSLNVGLKESDAYPGNPDSEYGWEKLFSERLYLAYYRNYGLNIRIARFHNIFGPEGTYKGGKEKAPAAICRKVAEAVDGGDLEIWGDGIQTRSFLYIDECIEGVRRLMESDFIGPVNIGSSEMVTINHLAYQVMKISGKNLNLKHIPGPQGVRGRNSDNTLIKEKLGWAPYQPLYDGLVKTFEWVNSQVNKSKEPFGGALPPADYQLDN